MLRFRGCALLLPCALALLAACLLTVISVRCVADDRSAGGTAPQGATDEDSSTLPIDEQSDLDSDDIVWIDKPQTDLPQADAYDYWSWQWLPISLIYHSYLAGVHEPRMALVAFSDLDGRSLWDATLGGRVGFLRYGNDDPVQPEGNQLDFYGAAIARLDADHQQDLESTDYVFGFPITYGVGQWQTKFGYAHLSSHLGDERVIRVPGSLNDRVNFVRDSLVFGTSYYANPVWRMYGEAGWAFHRSGGAGPWETQFGTELSRPGPTGRQGTPFLAVNGRLRENKNFGGDFTVQLGWLRRNILEQTLRVGAQYYNGKTSQFEFFDESEQQLGMGIWYDF